MKPQPAPHRHGAADAVLLHQARAVRDSDDLETRRSALSEAAIVILWLAASTVRPKFIREESER